MNLLKPQSFELTNYLTKHIRKLYTVRSYRNILTLNESKRTHVNSYYDNFSLSTINKFSTTNILSKQKSRIKDKNKVHVDVNALAEVIKLDHMTSQFDETIENFKTNLIKYVGIRSQVGAIESLPVTYEDNEYKLMELAEISRKPNMLVLDVSAFPDVIPSILEVLTKSHMNLNPQREGTTLYILIPKVTKEYRESLVKSAKQYFVKCKTTISDIRNQYVKKLKKADGISEDLMYNGEMYVNALQQEYVNKAEELLKTKQKELLGES